MLTIYKREMLTYLKTFIIWVICVAGMGFACILLYSTMQADMEEMAEGFASMGAFADAFGMSTLSIGTLTGFYATEVGTIHGLGGAMFAAIIGTVMLSKEEDGYTGEFLLSLPVSRSKIVTAKLLALISLVTLFQVICTVIYALGFVALGEEIPAEEFLLFHGLQLLLGIQIAVVCFAVSSFMKKNKLGIGLGIVLILYVIDMIARVVPDVEEMKCLSPYSYANAAELLSGSEVYVPGLGIGVGVLLVTVIVSYAVYRKRDIVS